MGSPAPFIVGVPRSGTTLLRLMLDASSELAIPGETHFLPDLIHQWREMGRDAVPDDERRRAALELITGHPRWQELDIEAGALEEQLMKPASLDVGDVVRAPFLVHARTRGKMRWGDKTPPYITKMRRIQRAVPEAVFIHVIRDGRDVALSWGEVSWGVDDVAEAAGKWMRRIGIARRDASELRADRYFEVRYEDLVADPERALRRLATAIDLPWEDGMLDYHQGAEERMAPSMHELHSARGRTITADQKERQWALVSEPPRMDRVSRWRREMNAGDRRAFEAVAGEMLATLGYEGEAES